MAVTLDGTTGITSPGEQVNGNLNVTGSITAGSYVGIANGQLQTQIFTAPGTWTKPSSCTQVNLIVVGGGGGGCSANPASPVPAGNGGFAIAYNVPVSSPVAVTVGSGGTGAPAPVGSGTSGGSSSFGSAVSATGGSGSFPTAGTPGSATISSGTTIKTFPTAFNRQTGYSGGFGFIFGGLTSGAYPGPTSATTWTTSLNYDPGIAGNSVPSGAATGGVGGAIIVEFVG